MSDQNSNEKQDRKQKVIVSIFGAVILGAIGSGLWDLLAKPGLSKLGRIVITFLTLGSETVRDSAYSSAALDPYPLPSLILYFLLSFIPWFFAVHIFLDEYAARPFKQKLLKSYLESNTKNQNSIPMEQWVRPRRRVISWILMFLCISVFVAGYMSVNVINQAIVIRRTFFANLAICSPFTSDIQEKEFKARFAQVKTRSDFIPIKSDLEKIATKNGTALLKINLW